MIDPCKRDWLDTRIRAVIFDLAGTTIDFGSRAPAGAFIELFRRHGITLSQAEARGPMGMDKRDHIRALAQAPRVAQAWRDIHGSSCDDAVVDALYREFIPLQLEALPHYCEVIPGTLDTVALLRSEGIRIGATTGYNLEMTEVALASAAQDGFIPDAWVCTAHVPMGRPAPWMLFRCMESLNIYPPSTVVAVGDTTPDIQAGLNAGVWTVGVTVTGNALGLSKEDLDALSGSERSARIEAARQELLAAGAHFVIDSVKELPRILPTR